MLKLEVLKAISSALSDGIVAVQKAGGSTSALKSALAPVDAEIKLLTPKEAEVKDGQGGKDGGPGKPAPADKKPLTSAPGSVDPTTVPVPEDAKKK